MDIQYIDRWSNLAGDATVTDPQQQLGLMMLSQLTTVPVNHLQTYGEGGGGVNTKLQE